MDKDVKLRCQWVTNEPLYIDYHDNEWGVPEHDDRKLLELLVLEGAQAGLSWSTILRKRGGYKKAFDDFDAKKIVQYNERKLEQLLSNNDIIRNRRKIAAIIQNAKAFLAVQQEFGSFNAYIWQFVGGKPKKNAWKTLKEIPSKTSESETMSKDLIQRGFKFIGPTICYAFMQATGMINDHTVDCFRYNRV